MYFACWIVPAAAVISPLAGVFTDRPALRSILFILGALCILGLFAATGMA
jgi:hypothetical protein